MDKYEGLNRPETVCTEMRYQTTERKESAHPKPRNNAQGKTKKSNTKPDNQVKIPSETAKNSVKKNNYKRILTAVRYAACLLLLAVCLIGKFTEFKPAAQACDYIKSELERDITQEILEM